MSSVDPSSRPGQVGLKELAEALELRSVVFFEVSARRWNADPDIEERPVDEEKIDLKVMHKVQNDRISIRCRMVVSEIEGRVVVDASALFSVKDDPDVVDLDAAEEHVFDLEPEVLKAFISRVGIRVVYPYLREAVQESARKIRIKAPLLSLLRPGQLDIDEPEEPDF